MGKLVFLNRDACLDSVGVCKVRARAAIFLALGWANYRESIYPSNWLVGELASA